jgi:hypothetical protein
MVEIKVAAVEDAPTILALVLVALENVLPGKLDLFLRNPIKEEEENHLRNSNGKRDGTHGRFSRGIPTRKIDPAVKVERFIIFTFTVHDLGVPLEKKTKCSFDSADVNRLPETIQNEDVLVQSQAHAERVSLP